MKIKSTLLHYSLLFSFALSSYFAQSQTISPATEKKLYRANQLFTLKNYEAALPIFLEIDKEVKIPLANYKIGFCYFNRYEHSEKVLSIPYLEYAIKNYEASIPADAYYYMGQAYHFTYKFDLALENHKKYEALAKDKKLTIPEDQIRQMDNTLAAKNIYANKSETAINNMGEPINTKYTEYSPVITADESVLAFTSLRPRDLKTPNATQFEDVYITEKGTGSWKVPSRIPINTNYNVGSAGLSADGQKMLVYIGGINNTGDLYTIKLEGDKWSVPTKMGAEINSNYLETSASIASDEAMIFFASNKPGGFGGLDIYMVLKSPSGKWGNPINMGPTINTKYNEDAPFIHPDKKTLFFTSNGHKGMGGYDIYKTKLINNQWTTPINMGYPINTTYNDNYFVLSAEGKKGYLASDREGGVGGQDIYIVDMPKEEASIPLTLIKGRILAGDSLKPVPTAITVVDRETNIKMDYVYNPNAITGNYLIIFPPGKNYDMIIESKGYLPYTININVPNQTYFYELFQQINLKAIRQFDEIVGQEVSVQNAFYDSKNEPEGNIREQNEAMLVRDSLDLYDMMDAIISSSDSMALDYLLGLMYNINPIEDVDFSAVKSSEVEATGATYYFEENDKNKLQAKIVGNDTIFSLPTLYTFKEDQHKNIKEEKPVEIIDEKIINNTIKIYFDSDKSALKPEYAVVLDNMVTELKKYKTLMAEISGYADSDGDAAHNLKLSNDRAKEVLAYLNERGISRRKIIAKGYGSDGSINKNTDSGNKQESRRVEIRLVK